MKKAILATLGAATLVLASFAAHAEGIYAGFNLGSAEQKVQLDPLGSFKDHTTGAKIYGGYNFNKNFGAEVGFVEFGNANWTVLGVSISAKPRSFYVAGTGTLPITDTFSVFAKLGISDNRTKGSVSGVAAGAENKTTPLVGIGASYAFTKNISAVVEYEDFGKVLESGSSNLKLNLLSVGVRYAF